MPTKRTILAYSKQSERDGGRWLLEHDGPDPRPGFGPGEGLVTSTGRIGHIHELQLDLISRSYGGENKHVLLNKTWTEWWTKVLKRAAQQGKHALLRIDPSNKDPRMPVMHVITEERHAQLLRFERLVLGRPCGCTCCSGSVRLLGGPCDGGCGCEIVTSG